MSFPATEVNSVYPNGNNPGPTQGPPWAPVNTISVLEPAALNIPNTISVPEPAISTLPKDNTAGGMLFLYSAAFTLRLCRSRLSGSAMPYSYCY